MLVTRHQDVFNSYCVCYSKLNPTTLKIKETVAAIRLYKVLARTCRSGRAATKKTLENLKVRLDDLIKSRNTFMGRLSYKPIGAYENLGELLRGPAFLQPDLLDDKVISFSPFLEALRGNFQGIWPSFIQFGCSINEIHISRRKDHTLIPDSFVFQPLIFNVIDFYLPGTVGMHVRELETPGPFIKFQCLKFLIDQKADVNAFNTEGESVLHGAYISLTYQLDLKVISKDEVAAIFKLLVAKGATFFNDPKVVPNFFAKQLAMMGLPKNASLEQIMGKAAEHDKLEALGELTRIEVLGMYELAQTNYKPQFKSASIMVSEDAHKFTRDKLEELGALKGLIIS